MRSSPNLPPLLERDTALTALRMAVEEATAGRGSLAVVSGEPGVGKSALIEHLGVELRSRVTVLVGVCDDLATPRPLGPFRDLAPALSGVLAARLDDGLGPGEFPELLLAELRAAAGPTVLVLEDVHWADQATADALTVVGRRLRDLPVVLVLTLRPGDLDLDHPMRRALDAVQRSTTRHLELAPLTRDAVRTLADAHDAGHDADHVHRMSGGNPFFVTELLAARDGPPPPSLANAVLGRVARLEEPTRRLLELVSLAPGRLHTEVLDRLEPSWPTAAAPAERRQLLTSDAAHVRFRQELTRAAIRSSVPPGRRRRLHRRILDVMLETDADPVDVVHHAEGAGAFDLVAERSLLAARQATALGANREAVAHHRRAAALADGWPAPDRARAQEELARAADLVGAVDEALLAATAAIEHGERLGDRELQGRCRGLRAHLHWYRGAGEAAWRDACDAVRDLQGAGSSAELGRAYARAAELSMLAARAEDAFEWGRRALQLARHDPGLEVHALASIGAMRFQLDPDDVAALLRAFETAHETRRHDLAVYVLVALAFTNMQWSRPQLARAHAEQGVSYARAHEVDGMTGYLEALLAWVELREGNPDRAERLRVVGAGHDARSCIVDLQVRTVLAELAVRTGAHDPDTQLRALWPDVIRTGELKRIGPVLELEVERAVTMCRPLPEERFAEAAEVVGPRPLVRGCGAARVAAWAAVAGVASPFEDVAAEPYAAMLAGNWRAAAEAFGAVGWTHDRALLLAMTDDEDALLEALQLARSLEAGPLEEHVGDRLRARGTPVPRGPATSTRTNPAGLTDRQLEVLRLIRLGERNARIGEVLHISPRTVERHVADIFTKLGVSTRAEAVARCLDLGVA